MAADTRSRKAALRDHVLTARARLSATQRTVAGAAIAAAGVAEWSGAGCVAAYLSIGTEPATWGLVDGLMHHGVSVLLPVIDGEELVWAGYTGADSVAAGPLGILEPITGRRGPRALESADAVIVPALAVDACGNRLGRGRGYYDRVLSRVTARVVAVGYDDELIDDVPVEAHDRPVNAILRPLGIRDLG